MAWSVRDQTPSASDLTKPERLREAAEGKQSEPKSEHHDEAEQINTANFPTFDERHRPINSGNEVKPTGT